MIQPAVPDPPELDEVLWKDFPQVRVAFDIGANCGQTLDRIAGFSTTVVAFEPAEEAVEYLQAHFGDREDIIVEDLALSSVSGGIDLMAAPSKIETGQLVTHGTAGMEWSEDEMANGVIRRVKSFTLDDYLDIGNGEYAHVGFLKIDVEGHELEVLRGATRTLELDAPHMLIEVHSEHLGNEIQKLLEDRYYLDLVRHPHYQVGTLLWRTHFWYRCFPKADIP
jgi:FkbM family methyltransferase